MEGHIAAVLPYAVAVALSPMPIAALVLMLLSNRAVSNSISFSLGWIAGLATLVFFVKNLVLLFGSTAHEATGISIQVLIHFVLGMVLILFAIKELHSKPRKGQEPKMPTWMSAIVSLNPLKAFVIGFLLATVNLKNTPMGITVGAVITDSGAYATTVLIIYLLLASATITVPTVGFILFGKKLEGTLEKLKSWLVTNNSTIMFVLFLILGIVLLSKALAAS